MGSPTGFTGFIDVTITGDDGKPYRWVSDFNSCGDEYSPDYLKRAANVSLDIMCRALEKDGYKWGKK